MTATNRSNDNVRVQITISKELVERLEGEARRLSEEKGVDVNMRDLAKAILTNWINKRSHDQL